MAGITGFAAYAQAAEKTQRHADISAEKTDMNMIYEYIKSKGYSDPISFDASNIKLFWGDKSVMGKNQLITIDLNTANRSMEESKPLKIVLANVNESKKCNVDVITDDPDVSFSILNTRLKQLSSSLRETFIQDNIVSCSFNLEDTLDSSFYMKFSSKTKDTASIKKIVLSFSDNQDSTFLFVPGTLNITKNDITVNRSTIVGDTDITISGKQSEVFTKKKIAFFENGIKVSVKIKNIGTNNTTVYTGIAMYSKTRENLSIMHFPYGADSKTLKVVSAKKGNNTIIVDSYPNWSKSCHLALNAKEDLSDLPNTSLADGDILKIEKMDNGHGKITMSKPLQVELPPGTKVRVHGAYSGQNYKKSKMLQPGEEATFSYEIQKDENFYHFSSQAIPRGVYYVRPVVFSYSVTPQEENTIQISDYTISY